MALGFVDLWGHMNRSVTAWTPLLIMGLFLLQPVGLGAWFSLLPEVQLRLGASKSELAFALLGAPISMMISMQLAGYLINRSGPRRLLFWALIAQAGTILLPPMAASIAQLFAALALFGVAMAFAVVALNVYAGRLEQALGRAIMGRCHGFWALGVMLGPLLMAAFASLGTMTALTIVSVGVLPLALPLIPALPHIGAEPGGAAQKRLRIREVPAALIMLALFVLSISMTEGAMSDWSAIYLAERFPNLAVDAGLGVSVYAGFLAFGRFTGDTLQAVFGPVRLARIALAIAVTGLLILAVPSPMPAAFVAFALVGLGVSVGFPLAVTAAARIDPQMDGPYIAAMSLFGSIGFLIGPPLIGTLADAATLSVGMAALVPGLVLSAVLARALAQGAGAWQADDHSP